MTPFPRKPVRRSTPPGDHRPVLLAAVLDVLNPQPGQVAVDCTLGAAGHAVELLRRVAPTGRLLGLDLDAANLGPCRERLAALDAPFSLHRANFAGLPSVLADEGVQGADALLADLGMSSMQVDDASRGFSYRRNGPLDMRMDPSRGLTAADILAGISEDDLACALHELGDEPDAARIARAIVAARQRHPLAQTEVLVRVIFEAVLPGMRPEEWRLRPARNRWELHPAARTFQVLRILVNRELGNLQALLRALPACLRTGGCAAILTYHSGEDRLVKMAFRQGLRDGLYREISSEPIRPSAQERQDNPRARSAKLRWARRAAGPPEDWHFSENEL